MRDFFKVIGTNKEINAEQNAKAEEERNAQKAAEASAELEAILKGKKRKRCKRNSSEETTPAKAVDEVIINLPVKG